MQIGIPCLFMRGGTSRGPYFIKQDLPSDEISRNNVLLAVMGSPDERQINGIGGGTTLTSKVAILSPSQHLWADVDYLFAQVNVLQPKVDFAPSCGNILAGVGPAAIERNLVAAVDGKTTVKIHAVNTGSLIEAVVCTPGGQVTYEGNTVIDGVPGSAAPILLNFMKIVGSKTGKLLPTGYTSEEIEGVQVTCIDVAVPMAIAQAKAFGKTGYETKTELDADTAFLQKIEVIRRLAGERMGLGNVANSVIPKFAIIAPPRQGGSITSRYFVPDTCHAAHAVTGAICVASSTLLPGSVADGIAKVTDSQQQNIIIEHPSGKLEISLVIHQEGSEIVIERAGVIRTARLLFSGNVYVSSHLWT
ncbi:4-oxalomesaconate tautomerase [Anabaena aphanizomenioides LEGE 00250]|uniref:4-oxalomesaconate tautomerase n=1 Tax=Sphaerospermopsis aphanizomenoides LEGE 00250 TaxID=2777972 RepID=A0ABR9VIL8_9CYAN|nr:4-oxalomesaconate tautomerase [Sphaerospermopsis aphanizomenoides]MBE9238346.1 4-oxalomesaconate tautomerase [Sphaerospermopsis aphanizomenoides LEGE 00250]